MRLNYDPDGAKKLLADAGYPNGFEVGMDCPNDRYVNDEAICQAVVGMLARVGVKVNLNAQPKAKYFAKVLKPGDYKTSFYLLGWTPGSFDSHNILFNIMGCRDDAGVEPRRIEPRQLLQQEARCADRPVLVENDEAKRDDLIKDASRSATTISATSRCTSSRWPGASPRR